MDQKDLEQISEVVEKAVKKGLGEFWVGNLEPAFDSIHERIDVIETKLDKALVFSLPLKGRERDLYLITLP